MKRLRLEEQGFNQDQHPNPTSDELEDCTFYDCLYESENDVLEESDTLIASKILEIEKEIDKLSDDLKEAYFIALQQEIKQQTHYVRSGKFLLLFLRADNFNAKKAALRLVKFFKYKLELFGPQMLPRTINQDDLNEHDKNLLASGWIQYSGKDCGGRLVLFYQRLYLQNSGYLNEQFFDTIKRVFFYVHFSAAERNEAYQQKGLVAIRWNLNCNMVLKDEQLIFRSGFIRMGLDAIPMRFVSVLICYNNSIATKCVDWSMSVMPKPMGLKALFINGQSPTDCFLMLSKYGINVDDLPITANGAFKKNDCLKLLEELQQEEFVTMLNEMDCINEIEDNEFISSTIAPQTNTITSVKNPSLIFTTDIDLNSSPKDFNAPIIESAIVMPLKYNTFSSKYSNRSKSTGDDKFPCKLMEVLQNNPNPDAIQWSRGGTAFVIEKRKFSESVLPYKFGGIKFGSFLRQLQRWNFQRIPNKKGGANYMEYNHKLFQRSAPHLLKDWDFNKDSPKRDKLPSKLWKIMETNPASDCIWWVCNGEAFAIDMNKFSQVVLKTEFEGLKVSSFLRMLRKWGFKRIADKEGTGKAFVFQHALFQKNKPIVQVLREHWAESNDKEPVGGNFPKKLYTIISNKNYNGTIRWLQGGDKFAIEPGEFTRLVLSKEYNGIKFKSFTRNLQRWGFKQLPPDASSINARVFQHPSFQKNSPELLGKWNYNEKAKPFIPNSDVGKGNVTSESAKGALPNMTRTSQIEMATEVPLYGALEEQLLQMPILQDEPYLQRAENLIQEEFSPGSWADL